MPRIPDDFSCPICGQPLVHYRRFGYRCPNPEHGAQEIADEIRKGLKQKTTDRKGARNATNT